MSGMRLYFNGTDQNGFLQLFESDGTAAGTLVLTSQYASASGLDPIDLTSLQNVTLFAGTDAQGQVQLWVTDGEPLNTSPVIVSTASANGLQPSDITPFGNGALFSGADATGLQLFYTDGTSNGTLDLTGGDGVQGGPAPSQIATLAGGQTALFSGFAADGSNDLWMSNGTAAGTAPVMISDASAQGLAPQDIVAFGAGALFVGTDVNDAQGLYVTDGTAAGTTEIATAAPNQGISGLVVLGSTALFDNANELGVTNGTAAGTSVIVPVTAGAEGLQPSDLTVSGNQAFFSGVDAIGHTGLWVTNGTNAGTTQISPAGGAATGLSPADITAFGSGVLFSGTDASGLNELWFSDGTAAGTYEIAPASASATLGLSPTDITPYGSQAAFDGLDANGDEQLWLTNGTVSGTVLLSSAATNVNGLQPTDIAAGPFVACYVAGTLILTDRGERPVETLAPGDLVITGCGSAEPVRWIGRRSYGARAVASQPSLAPVRLCAGALGDGLPRRDLLVSPKHAMFIDGYLIPADVLVNGSTVTREPDHGALSYYHIELDAHDIVFAEGALSESFLDDNGSRAAFNNAAEWQPRFSGLDLSGPFCAPRISDGMAVETVRRRIARLAGRDAESGAPVGIDRPSACDPV